MKYISLFFLIVCLSSLYTACSPKLNSGGSKGDISFETLAKEFYGNVGLKQALILKESKAFDPIWKQAYGNVDPRPNLPEIDFSKEMAIAVFLGTKNSGGFDIEIMKIKELETHIEVFVKNTRPDPDGMVTMALTSPFHIVKLKKQSKEVKFIFE